MTNEKFDMEAYKKMQEQLKNMRAIAKVEAEERKQINQKVYIFADDLFSKLEKQMGNLETVQLIGSRIMRKAYEKKKAKK